VKLLAESAKNTKPITSFFQQSPAVASTIPEDFYDDLDAPEMSFQECIDKLTEEKCATVSSNGKYDKVTNYEHLRFLSIQRFFTLRLDGVGKMEASSQACLIMSSTPKDYLSRCIRTWADNYASCGELPGKIQGKHMKPFSFPIVFSFYSHRI